MSKIERLLEQLEKIEPMPMVVSKLSAVVTNPNSTLADITRVISYDQSLVANLLRWANSALWARQKPVVLVKDAIVQLGAGRILEIIVGQFVKPSFENSLPEYGLDSKELWKHAVAASLASEELNQFSRISLPSETFTAALLHDVGKVVLKQIIDPEKLNEILELSSTNGTTYLEAEKKVLGFSHANVGYRMTKKWNFSNSIAESILYHHEPDEHQSLVTDAVHVSNICAKILGLGLGNESLNLSGSSNSATRLGISRKNFEQICYEVSEKLPEIEKLYN